MTMIIPATVISNTNQREPEFVSRPGTIEEYSASKAHAKSLARRIEEKWERLGYEVNCTVEGKYNRQTGGIIVFEIRSDMINGLPRGQKREDK